MEVHGRLYPSTWSWDFVFPVDHGAHPGFKPNGGIILVICLMKMVSSLDINLPFLEQLSSLESENAPIDGTHNSGGIPTNCT